MHVVEDSDSIARSPVCADRPFESIEAAGKLLSDPIFSGV